MNENKIYKKKIIDPSPNKLFIAWMEDITKNAKKNKCQSYFTYKKALKSIKFFPLLLKSGKDCFILEGFGPKICDMLDKKLYEFARNEGLTISKALKKGNNLFSKQPRRTYSPLVGSDSYAILLSLNELHANSENIQLKGFDKNEIIQVGSKYQRKPAKSTKAVGIWKGMKKLLDNGTVTSDGESYWLSSDGLALCCDLLENRDGQTVTNAGAAVFSSDDEVEEPMPAASSHRLQPLFYCKSLDPLITDLVDRKSDAASRMIDGKLFYRVKVKYDDLVATDVDYQLDLDAPFPDEHFTLAYLHDDDAPATSCPAPQTTAPADKPPTVSRPTPMPPLTQPALNGKPIVTKATGKTSAKQSAARKRSATGDSLQTTSKCVIERSTDGTLKAALAVKDQSSLATATVAAIDQSQQSVYVMPAQSFRVILIVDNRESYGTGKLKGHLCADLAKKGIQLETRVLPIGDFAWIARDDVGREAVLDIIVERKRYDDLAKSITDNRFKDQKLRMKRSGISKIIYILEKCKGMKNLSISVDTLHQALVNSEINDHCDIKITDNGADTISYLNLLTKKLCKFYSNKSLHIYLDNIPGDGLHANPFHESARQFSAIDYTSFSEAGQKTKPMRISEMFAKHVNCIHGITVERSRALVDKYPVPRLLT